MGYISNLAKSVNSQPDKQYATMPTSPQEAIGQGRAIWREVFGVDKENPNKDKIPTKPVYPGGSWGRSIANSSVSFAKLLEAMRSRAPGSTTQNYYELSSHMVGIAYVAIHRTNEMLSQAEFQVFEKDSSHPEGKRPVPEEHPLVRLLGNPNNEDSFGDLVGMINMQMDLTGTALLWMVPNAMGRPYELYPIPTATAIPQPVVNPDYPEGYYRIQPIFPYGGFSHYPSPASAVGAAIPAQWMLRIKYNHPLLRYEGYSPLSAMKLHFDEVESMDKSRFYSMKRSINPSAVLNFEDMEGMQPLTEPEIERIRAEFENDFQGVDNHGRLIVATPGGKLERWDTRPIDMDYQEGWDQLTSFCLGAMGVTKPAAGMIEDSSYATLFATLKQLYWLTLDPKCSRISNKLTKQLAPYFGDNLLVEVRCKRLDDHEISFAKIDRGTSSKSITKNEVRKLLELTPTQEPWGEEISGTEPMLVDPLMQEEMNAGVNTPMSYEEQLRNSQDPLRSMVDEGEEEPDLITASRDNPKTLNDGSLGPRKTKLLPDYPTKSLYEQIREACSNGHH